MRFVVVVLALFPAVFAGLTSFQQADLKIHQQETVTVSTKRLSAVVNIKCRTGAENDGFEVVISPNAGAIVSHSKLSGKGELFGEAVESDTHINGKMKDHLNVDQSSGRCAQGNGKSDCSYVYSGVVTFIQEQKVPDSVSPLLWRSSFKVDFQCALSPENPESDDTVNNVVPVSLQECEPFEHSLTIGQAAGRDNSVVTVKLSSPIARSGYGYKMSKCMLTLPGISPAFPLLLNGKTQKNNRFEVIGRSVDGGAGEAFQFNLNGIATSEVIGGNLECEVERCRSAVVGSASVAQCVRGSLLSDFVAVSGRGMAPAANPLGKVPLSGSVKLYIAQSGAARSSVSQLRECIGTPASA